MDREDCGPWTCDDCRGKQHRSQLVVIHSEADKYGQTDHAQHKTHPEDTDNGGKAPQVAFCERNWMSRGQIHGYTLN